MTREGGWIEAKFDNGAKSYYIHPHIKDNVLGIYYNFNNYWSFMEGEELDMVGSYTEGYTISIHCNPFKSMQKNTLDGSVMEAVLIWK